MPRTGSSGTAYGSVPTSARALSSVSGGPVRAYGPTMRPTVGAGAVDRGKARWASSAATSSAGWAFTADLRSAATVVGAAGADRTRCICRGAAGGTAAGSSAAGAGSAFAVATSPLFCTTARCLGRTPEPRYRPAPSASTTVAAHASGSRTRHHSRTRGSRSPRRNGRGGTPHPPPQPDGGLAVARSERRDGTVRGCGESEQLIRTRDKRPLLLQTDAALAALRHVRFQVVRLARRELAVEIGVQGALIHVRHVHPSFSLRMLPPGGGGPGRGAYRWRRAPAPSAPRSRRTTIPNPTAAALPGRAA